MEGCKARFMSPKKTYPVHLSFQVPFVRASLILACCTGLTLSLSAIEFLSDLRRVSAEVVGGGTSDFHTSSPSVPFGGFFSPVRATGGDNRTFVTGFADQQSLIRRLYSGDSSEGWEPDF